jgi:serine protease Do
MNDSIPDRYRPTARRDLRAILAGCIVIGLAAVSARADGPSTDATTARLEAATARLEAAANRLETAGAGHSTVAMADEKPPFPPATPWAVVRVNKRVGDAVVRIDVAQEIYVDGKRTLRRGIGSGVIIDDAGHVLTNFHVAGRSAELYVTLASKERIGATLVGDDHWTDLAVVQINMGEVKRKGVTLSWAPLGESRTLLTGQDVMAIGTPFGLNRTTTLGQVSNNERTFYPERMTIDMTREENLETGDFSNWVQMDTPINPGNSGGPLVDMNGFVVGINTRGGGQNLNFAIPIDTAKPVIAAILKSATADKKGRVDRSDLGIDFKPLQDLETFYDVDIDKGVLVNSVDPLGAANKAGLRSQDILMSVNGQPTNCRFPEEIAPVRLMIANLPIGSTVDLEFRRGKKTLHAAARTLKLQSVFGEQKELKVWGMSVREVTRAYASDAQLDDDTGVAIETLTDGHPAAEADLQRDDIIHAVDGKPVPDLDEFLRLYKQSVATRAAKVGLDIRRGHGDEFKVMTVTYDAAAGGDEKADAATPPSTQTAN